MKRWIDAIALVALVVGVAMLGGCGGEKKTEMAQTAAASKDAIEQAATEVDLPDGFPSDIPLYPGAKLVRTANQPGGIIMVKLSSGDAVAPIAKFYQDELGKSGWTDRKGMDNPAGGKVLNFEKNDTALTVQLTERPDATRISLNVATNK